MVDWRGNMYQNNLKNKNKISPLRAESFDVGSE
jgi:hypothetical protein